MDADQVLALEDARCRAMVDGDVDAMQRLFAEGMRYTHSYGATDSKESLIALITSGNVTYRGIHRSEIEVATYPGAAVVTGRARLELTAKGEDRTVHCKFTVTWADTADGAVFASWQSTSVPPPDAD